MQRVFYILFLTFFLLGSHHLIAAEIDNGPEEINLMKRYDINGRKKPVIFKHRNHQGKLSCIKCHAKEDGGVIRFEINQKDTISNDFHRKVCWPCHKEMNVQSGQKCQLCHK